MGGTGGQALGSEWTDRYPSKESLRAEVDAMAESFVKVLLDRIPPDEIAGIYFKGSAKKRWDSPLDYVPEQSDVDIHLLFRDSASIERRLGSIESALDILSGVEDEYRSKMPSPIHLPRPQLTMLNRLMEEPNYYPSPKETVATLYGDEYKDEVWPDDERLREMDRANLLSHSPVLESFPLHVVDKPGVYLLAALRNLSWRVSPIGPRALSISGMPPRQAWSLNRTQIAPLLDELGQEDLARDYRSFYLSAWDYFLSGYTDSRAARAAVAAGLTALRASAEVAGKTGTSH
jgi:hypothetical protein